MAINVTYALDQHEGHTGKHELLSLYSPFAQYKLIVHVRHIAEPRERQLMRMHCAAQAMRPLVRSRADGEYLIFFVRGRLRGRAARKGQDIYPGLTLAVRITTHPIARLYRSRTLPLSQHSDFILLHMEVLIINIGQGWFPSLSSFHENGDLFLQVSSVLNGLERCR